MIRIFFELFRRNYIFLTDIWIINNRCFRYNFIYLQNPFQYVKNESKLL